MPTFPFQGAQGADKYSRFDVQKTPSKVGILTEVFRQTQGVERSKHPTHPVAAWGLHANEIVSTHHLGPTFGVTSPSSGTALPPDGCSWNRERHCWALGNWNGENSMTSHQHTSFWKTIASVIRIPRGTAPSQFLLSFRSGSNLSRDLFPTPETAWNRADPRREPAPRWFPGP